MADTKKKAFVNSQELPIEIGDLTGTFVIPFIISDIDAGIYLEAQRSYFEELKELAQDEKEIKNLKPLGRYPSQVQFDFIKHLVKKVDFPGTTLQQFRAGERPFYKIMMLVNKATKPLVEDAFSDPNS